MIRYSSDENWGRSLHGLIRAIPFPHFESGRDCSRAPPELWGPCARALLFLELSVALSWALQQEQVCVWGWRCGKGGMTYAGSRMNAGPLSGNTLNCSVCVEVAGMASMMRWSNPTTQQGKATFENGLVIFPHHKWWLNFRPHLPLSLNNNRNWAIKVFFPNKFKCFLECLLCARSHTCLWAF